MKCLGDGTRVHIVSSVKRSIFLSAKHSKASNPISKKLSRYSALSVSIALSMLLAAMVLSPSAPRMLTRGVSMTAFAQTPESITTYAAGCASAQPANTWNLGGTVCAKAMDSPGDRRIAWVAPDGSVAQVTGFYSGTLTDSYTIHTGSDPLAQVGTWTVETIDPNSSVFATAEFIVRDPANASADLSVANFGPFQASADSDVSYRVELTNKGPDDAQTVALTSSVPANTTFVSEMHTAAFSSATPDAGSSTGTIDYTIAILPANSTAVFTLVFHVNSGTPNGTVITDTASVSSTTNDPHLADNSSSSSTTVVAGSSGCTITCPSVTPVSTAQCNAVVTYGTPTTSGDCGGGVPVCSPPSGSVFPIGSTTVTCTSQSGDACSFAVAVNYTESSSAPTISCPSNVTVAEVNAGSATVNYTAPTTNGTCVTVVCSPPSGSVFSTGNTTVNCTATNPANNTASCSFTVTVTSTSCALDCPNDKTVNESSPGSGTANVTYSTATAVGCPSLTITCSPPSGSSFPLGSSTVICSGKNTSDVVVASCGFTVTVNSSSACAITCPANITQVANATCTNDNPPPSTTPCSAVTYVLPTQTGNCFSIPSCSPPSGSSFGIGTTIVHCTATDLAGNTSSCSFTVTVIGGTPCTIICPSVASQPSDAGGCTKVVTYSDPTTSGSCGDPANPHPWSCNPPSGSIFPVGTISVTCSTDVGTECSFPVTVTGTDTVAPVITTCATPTFALADSTCQAPVPNVMTDIEASDNCTPSSLLTVTQAPAAGTLVGTGTTAITVTVTDANNNSSTCTTSFFLFEPTPPTAACKNITVFLGATGSVSITGADIDNGSTDNCAIASRTATPSTFTCANKGSNPVTLTVTDPSGNTASCQTAVTVVDNTPPTIVCPANITKNNDPGQCSAVATYANATATDNCSGVGTPVCTPASGSTFQKGITTVTCSVSDASGNSSSCAFTVRVNDTQPPTIVCPANVITNAAPGVCTAVVTFAPTVSDNCPDPTFVCSPPSGSAFPLGTTVVACTATDASANSAGCTLTVTVNNPNPVVTITGPPSGALYSVNTAVNFTATFTDAGGGTHTGTWAFQSNLLSLTQAATIVEPSGSTPGSANTTFTFTSAGVYLVTLTVNDSCGGTGSANTVDVLTAMVVVYDPNGGFVTGGGWINSPTGAYTPNPSLTGKASFGFVSKYQNGAGVPTGNTEFQFRVANFNFHSTVYEWLVIAGARAQYKGSGTVNGAGDYRFMLTAIDGQVNGGGGVDKFRIRIWNNNGGGIVYDNQMNAPDTADPTTVLGGGSIVIHKDN